MSCRNIGTKRGAVCHLPDLGARNFAKEQLWVQDRCQYAQAGASHSLLQRSQIARAKNLFARPLNQTALCRIDHIGTHQRLGEGRISVAG